MDPKQVENKTDTVADVPVRVQTTLVELLSKIESTKELAETDLTTWDWRTRPSMEINKSEAKRTLVSARESYLKEFSTYTTKVFIDATPEQTNSFIELLRKEGATVLTTRNVYEYIAESIFSKLGMDSVFSTSAWLRLTEMTGDICRQLDCYPSKTLVQPPDQSIKVKQDLVDLVKLVLRDGFGDSLNKAYLTVNFLNTALVNKFDKNMAILVISGVNTDERASLMDSLFTGQPNFSLTMAADEVVDRSTMLKIYRRVYETSYKSRKATKKETKVESHQ